MKLTTLETRVIWALSDHGPAGVSTIMVHIEGLESKAQLQEILKGLAAKELVKFQSNGQWCSLKNAKSLALESAGTAVASSLSSATVPTAETQKAKEVRQAQQVPVKPLPETAQPTSGSLLMSVAKSLPEGAELRLNREAIVVLWRSLVFHSSAPELEGTIQAINTLDQQLVPQ